MLLYFLFVCVPVSLIQSVTIGQHHKEPMRTIKNTLEAFPYLSISFKGDWTRQPQQQLQQSHFQPIPTTIKHDPQKSNQPNMLVIPSSAAVQKKTQLFREKKRIILILRVAGMVFSLKFNGQKVSYSSEWTSLNVD